MYDWQKMRISNQQWQVTRHKTVLCSKVFYSEVQYKMYAKKQVVFEFVRTCTCTSTLVDSTEYMLVDTPYGGREKNWWKVRVGSGRRNKHGSDSHYYRGRDRRLSHRPHHRLQGMRVLVAWGTFVLLLHEGDKCKHAFLPNKRNVKIMSRFDTLYCILWNLIYDWDMKLPFNYTF